MEPGFRHEGPTQCHTQFPIATVRESAERNGGDTRGEKKRMEVEAGGGTRFSISLGVKIFEIFKIFEFFEDFEDF